MSGFKDMIERDNRNVFMNVEEFGESSHIVYNGREYDGIAVILSRIKDEERAALRQNDHSQGIYEISARMHVLHEDMGCIPEVNQRIHINGKEYYIRTSDLAAGMLILGLGGYDE